jgi:hypothetical protein
MYAKVAGKPHKTVKCQVLPSSFYPSQVPRMYTKIFGEPFLRQAQFLA